MTAVFDSPFTPAVLAALVAAFAFAAAARLAGSGLAAALGALAAFLAAYYETYQKIPAFPPSGAANKVFYVAVFGALAALALGRFARGRLSRAALALAVSAFAALWIGWPKFAGPDAWTYPLAGAATLGGALALGALDRLGAASGAAGFAGLAALFALSAPAALFAGSSTSVGVCLGAGAGAALLSLEALGSRRTLAPCGLLGAGSGLVALLDTPSLLSRAADPLALALIALAPVLGVAAVSASPAAWRARPAAVWLVGGLATLSPLPAILALLFLRHDNPLG